MSGKVALYARVSKADRTQDPENQLILLRERAEALDLRIVDEYVDLLSGARDHRPRLEALRAQARARQFDAVLATKLDRLGRSSLHLMSVCKEFEDYNARLILAEQPIDTGTPMGRFFLTVLAAVAELERGFIQERTMLGLARAARAGRRPGRHPLDCACGLEVRDKAGRLVRRHAGQPAPVDAIAMEA